MPQLNQPDSNGGLANNEVLPQKGEAGLHAGLDHMGEVDATRH